MLKRMRSILNPAAYHGAVLRPPFFEGWYFKLVDAGEGQRFAILPGVFMGRSAEESHAFVQVLNGLTGQVDYHTYPIEQFQSAADRFDIRIGENRFRTDAIHLAIDRPEGSVRGVLAFESPVGWPVSVLSPGIMGWYAWVPRMECYHGVLGFDHSIHGSLRVDGRTVDFSGGRGYIEKDWGMSFPQAWVWMQSNHFEQPGVCLTASVAIIPWLGNAFAGFIAGLWLEGALHTFATYACGRISALQVDDHLVRWRLENQLHTLEIEATRAEGGLLHAPTPSGMGRRIAETLSAEIGVRLVERPSGRLVFEGMGRHAGLEAVGDLARLQRMALKGK